MEKLDQIIFYSLEKAIKSYRQFAQKSINTHGLDITIDQWLVLKTIQDYPEFTQQQIAGHVFKDYASITRIIELLVSKNILHRTAHPNDRRRFTLTITPQGSEILAALTPVINTNRKQALKGIASKEIQELKDTLHIIIENCS